MRAIISRVVATAALFVALSGCASLQPDNTSTFEQPTTNAPYPELSADQAWWKCEEEIDRKWASQANIKYQQEHSVFEIVDGEWEITFNEAPDAPERSAPLYCATSGTAVKTYNPAEWEARH